MLAMGRESTGTTFHFGSATASRFRELDAGLQTSHVALHKMSDKVLTTIANDQIIRS